MEKDINTSVEKVKAVIYDEENIMDVIKSLDNIKVTGIEQCVLMTTIAQRLNSFIKKEEINIKK